MPLFSDLNFLATVLAFGTVSFAASNFGTKLGRVTGFQNRSGYQYVSELDEDKRDKLYEEIAKDAGPNAPYYWARDKHSLRAWCSKNERKARKWGPASQYCLVKNTVKHQLIKKGKTLVEEAHTASVHGCNHELWNSYDDGTKSSKGYLFAMTKCVKPDNANSEGMSINSGTSNPQAVSQASSVAGSASAS